jgi:predicted DNA-binding protein with PD1-like motif
MHGQLLHEADGQRVFALVLETGEEAMSCLVAFAASEALSAAQFTAIGAFQEAEIAYFDWQSRAYQSIPVKEQVEVASMIGDIALSPDGRPAVHAHAVLGRRDGSALAGHFTSGRVRPNLEILLTESPAHLRKRFDPASGLTLIRPNA